MYSKARATTRWTQLSRKEAKQAGTSARRRSRRIILKWDGRCSRCDALLPKGTEALYNPERRTVRHTSSCKAASSKGAVR